MSHRAPVVRVPWSGKPRRDAVGLMLYDRDEAGIWHRRMETGSVRYGETHRSLPSIEHVRDRPDLFRRFTATGRSVPRSEFFWMRDAVNNRTVSVHGILVPGDLGKNSYPKEFGVWTGGGFYSLTSLNVHGYTNETLLRHHEEETRVTVAPLNVSRFITTRWGYVVPISIYQMVTEFVHTGDLLGAWRRVVSPRTLRGKSKEVQMAAAKKAFSSPSARHHLAHELKAAIEDRGLSVSWIAEQIQNSIEEARGEKKIAGLKFLMEVHEASAVAKSQAAGMIPGELVATVDVLPSDRDPRQFTRGEIQTFMSSLEN